MANCNDYGDMIRCDVVVVMGLVKTPMKKSSDCKLANAYVIVISRKDQDK
jgi:hypothetical protein